MLSHETTSPSLYFGISNDPMECLSPLALRFQNMFGREQDQCLELAAEVLRNELPSDQRLQFQDSYQAFLSTICGTEKQE